jgi:hypothetical protein
MLILSLPIQMILTSSQITKKNWHIIRDTRLAYRKIIKLNKKKVIKIDSINKNFLTKKENLANSTKSHAQTIIFIKSKMIFKFLI